MLTYHDWEFSVRIDLHRKLSALNLVPKKAIGIPLREGKVPFYLHPWINKQKLFVSARNGKNEPLSSGLDGVLDQDTLAVIKTLEKTEHPIPYTVHNVDGMTYFAHELFEKFLSKHSDTLIDYYQTQIEGGASEQEQDYAVLMVQTVRTYEALKEK